MMTDLAFWARKSVPREVSARVLPIRSSSSQRQLTFWISYELIHCHVLCTYEHSLSTNQKIISCSQSAIQSATFNTVHKDAQSIRWLNYRVSVEWSALSLTLALSCKWKEKESSSLCIHSIWYLFAWLKLHNTCIQHCWQHAKSHGDYQQVLH